MWTDKTTHVFNAAQNLGAGFTAESELPSNIRQSNCLQNLRETNLQVIEFEWSGKGKINGVEDNHTDPIVPPLTNLKETKLTSTTL